MANRLLLGYMDPVIHSSFLFFCPSTFKSILLITYLRFWITITPRISLFGIHFLPNMASNKVVFCDHVLLFQVEWLSLLVKQILRFWFLLLYALCFQGQPLKNLFYVSPCVEFHCWWAVALQSSCLTCTSSLPGTQNTFVSLYDPDLYSTF